MAMYPCLFGGGSTPTTLITKSITQNGTYNAQDDNADGYSSVEVDVSGGGGSTVEQCEYLEFDGSQYIELPYNLTSPERSYYIDFTTETQAAATGYHAIFGIKNEYNDNFVGIRYYQLRYQIGQNGGSTNISNSWEELTGRHNFLYDAATSTVYFDTNVHTYSYNPGNTVGDSYKLIIGSAKENPAKTDGFIGKIHRFTIKNTTTAATIADYVPGVIKSGTTPILYGFIDLVTNTFLPQNLISSNDLSYPINIDDISKGSMPVLIYTSTKNRSSSNVLSYTFAESGTFQYYIYATSDTLLSSSDLAIQLNGSSLIPLSIVNDVAPYYGLFYNEMTVVAGDVITADITRANNRGMQLYIFKDSDISRTNIIGYAGNDGSTFTINVDEGMPFVETYYYGYYSGNNYYSYFVGIAPSSSLALKSIPTPNQSMYWYGGTCVFTI